MHMNKLFKNSLAFGVIALQLAVPAMVLAQDGLPEPPTGVSNICELLGLVNKIANWLLVVLVVLAVIFVIVAAFNYLTAGGDSEKVGEANKKIVYAAVAVAVGLLAKAVPYVVSSVLNIDLIDCVPS